MVAIASINQETADVGEAGKWSLDPTQSNENNAEGDHADTGDDTPLEARATTTFLDQRSGDDLSVSDPGVCCGVKATVVPEAAIHLRVKCCFSQLAISRQYVNRRSGKSMGMHYLD